MVLVVGVLLVVRGAMGGTDGEAHWPLRTVFVGDSITRGVGPGGIPSAEESWVTYAVSHAGSPWLLTDNVAEFGLSLGQMHERFADEVLSQHPDAVVIMGGTNDVLRGLPVQESMGELRSMVEEARADGIRVWVVSPPPIDPGYGKSPVDIVAAERNLCAELHVPFVETLAAMSDPDGSWRDGYSVDGVHPTAYGARRLADAVIEAVAVRPSASAGETR